MVALGGGGEGEGRGEELEKGTRGSGVMETFGIWMTCGFIGVCVLLQQNC